MPQFLVSLYVILTAFLKCQVNIFSHAMFLYNDLHLFIELPVCALLLWFSVECILTMCQGIRCHRIFSLSPKLPLVSQEKARLITPSWGYNKQSELYSDKVEGGSERKIDCQSLTHTPVPTTLSLSFECILLFEPLSSSICISDNLALHL